jgi:two-component sensor histidine kinase
MVGVLDLRGWDFERDGPVRLSGEWLFAPGRLLDTEEMASAIGLTTRVVPDYWRGADAGGAAGQGAGTYRLRVLLPAQEKTGLAGRSANRDLAIRVRTVSTSYEMDANGLRIANAGKPALKAADAVAAYRSGVWSLPGSSDYLDFVVRVSNHEYRCGGMWRAFELGPRGRLVASRQTQIVLILVFIGAIISISFNSFVLFVFRRQEKSYFYFVFFALAVVLRSLVTGEYLLAQVFPSIPFEVLIRLEYLSAFTILPLGVLFLSEIFPLEASRTQRLALTIPCFSFCILLFLCPLPILTRSIFLYYAVAIATMVATFLVIVGRALLRRRPDATAMFVGCIIILLAGINDMLFSTFLVPTGNLLVFSLVIFTCLQSVVLARRFTDSFYKREALSSELSVTNELLEQEIGRYQDSQRRLEALLTEKETLLKEVHHRVKNSLQIVSSIMALQAHRSTDPQVEASFESMRDRIRSISLVHEKLYGSSDSDSMDLGEYARDLVLHLKESYSASNQTSFDIEVKVEKIDVRMDICIDMGLILTELIANAFRHGILPLGYGKISVVLRHEEESVLLSVHNDGPGFRPGFSPGASNSLGFRIVTSLVRKHKGTIVIAPGEGATVELRLPVSDESPGQDEKKSMKEKP